MNALIIAVFACLAAASAAPSLGHGAIVAGPSGIVTGHGAIGPIGLGHGTGAIVAGPSVAGLGLGLGGWGLGWGHGLLGHGVHVQGPGTVPATIVGPSGAIHASGLWGPTHLGLGHGHIW